jgi:hypothetical protein
MEIFWMFKSLGVKAALKFHTTGCFLFFYPFVFFSLVFGIFLFRWFLVFLGFFFNKNFGYLGFWGILFFWLLVVLGFFWGGWFL